MLSRLSNIRKFCKDARRCRCSSICCQQKISDFFIIVIWASAKQSDRAHDQRLVARAALAGTLVCYKIDISAGLLL
ncbi:MAG: hypothetical protein HUJ51_01880 [Eggerthellaceae bacterium]|nr:hypothetical protein [Eggerthellaceae bacterium]